jgi:hypothetical protein
MPIFVHLAAETRVSLIRRNGIRVSKSPLREYLNGVFAMPVTRNFYVSHQWLRELKRRGQGPLVGIYFRISDDQKVWVGHYGRNHDQLTAAEAVAEFMSAENREGWEVIIPRRIESNEIHRVRSLPQVTGWRYYPESKGKPPFCACKYCTRGDFGSAKLRARLIPPET